MRLLLPAAVSATILAACAGPSPGPGPQGTTGFDPAQLAKSDVDRFADEHRREVFASLRLLAEKLYKRNPHEWQKGGQAAGMDAAIGRLFEPRYAWRLPEFEGRWGTDLVLAGLREDYRGDRVAAFVGGLGGMLDAAFAGKTEFFMFDDLDAQKLYNSARNVEIAAWKLGHARDAEGRLLLLSNEMSPDYNLSFEREFGKMIGNLDLLAKVIADKNHRTIAKAIQSIATAVFLPVAGLK
jgi:hypothetical protein